MPQPEQGSPTDAGTTGERRENHYVLVIHGTGAAPEKKASDEAAVPPADSTSESAGGMARSSQASRGTPATGDKGPPGGATELEKDRKWYQSAPGDKENFCHRLDLELQRLGWAPSVWRTPEAFARAGRVLEFSWSGGNTHEQRTQGATELATLLLELREADPDCRIHLIAHSHGGNVALAAVERHLQWMRHLEGEKASAGILAWQRALDPGSHRLGRLVLLGTPFYYKRWLAGVGPLERFLTLGVDWFFNVLFCGLFWYLALLVLMGIASVLPWVEFEGWAPWRWSIGWWILGAMGTALTLRGIGQDKIRRDVNLYFAADWGFVEGIVRSRLARPLEALVVSAGLLDEALLALSTQPLASAFLVPALRDALKPRWWRKLEPLPVGIKQEPPQALKRLFKGLMLVPLNLVLLPWTILRWLLAPLIAAWVAGKTRTALSAAALGVPAGELESARIEVQGALDPVPGVLAPVGWEIERQLSETPSPDRLVAGGAAYPFLWNEHELERQLEGSKIWRRVEPEVDAILRRLGLTDAGDREARILRLKRICVSLEERGREVVGSIELLHSAYYARPEFVRAIARFLVLGEPPPGAAAAERQRA